MDVYVCGKSIFGNISGKEFLRDAAAICWSLEVDTVVGLCARGAEETFGLR